MSITAVPIAIPLIIALFVLISQFCLALLGAWYNRRLARKYNYPLSSMTQVAQMLETYSRMYHSIDIKVNARLQHPAKASKQILLMNKAYVYHTTLYANLYTIYQISLNKAKNNFVNYITPIQTTVFLAQLGTLCIGVWWIPVFIWVSVVLGGLLFIFAFIFQAMLTEVLDDSLEISQTILHLDVVEQELALKLVDDLKGVAFIYPLVPFQTIAKFLLPF